MSKFLLSVVDNLFQPDIICDSMERVEELRDEIFAVAPETEISTKEIDEEEANKRLRNHILRAEKRAVVVR
jgi:hypothetical protein